MDRMRRVVSVAVCMFSLGCTGPDGDAEGEAEAGTETPPAADTAGFTTDAEAYTLRRDGRVWATSIGFRYRNAGEDTVYIVNCNGAIVMTLQRRTGDDWQTALPGVSNACLSPPLRIPPGAALRSTVGFAGAEMGTPDGNAFLVPEIEGEYRLMWSQLVRGWDESRPGFGDTLALADRVSTPFRLELPDSARASSSNAR